MRPHVLADDAGNGQAHVVCGPKRGAEQPLCLFSILARVPGEENDREVGLGCTQGATIAKLREDGQLFFFSDAEGFVELSASVEDVGDFAEGDGARVGVANSLQDRKRLVAQQVQRLVDLSVSGQEIRKLSQQDRSKALALGRLAKTEGLAKLVSSVIDSSFPLREQGVDVHPAWISLSPSRILKVELREPVARLVVSSQHEEVVCLVQEVPCAR
ncbi:MAG: hypothetical protein R3F14_36255 [Polyangiaceae bacterium]